MVIREPESRIDYSAVQVEAARSVLLELSNILSEYQDCLMIVGGWVPELLFPGEGHVGSLDVDLLLDHRTLAVHEMYLTIERVLTRNNYEKHPEQFFTFVRRVMVGDTLVSVGLDLLAGVYDGTAPKKRAQHVQGIRALKATGGDFAFLIPAKKVAIEGRRPDGARDSGIVRVAAVAPFFVMKAAALGRGKAKDAYDIYFCTAHYPGGIESLAEEFRPHLQNRQLLDALEKIAAKFATPEHAGPVDVADFMELPAGEEREILLRDVCERVTALLKRIRTEA